MESATIIIDRAPYGYEDAFSGLYVCIACLNKHVDSDVLLLGDGVYAALEGQDSENRIKFPSVEELTYLIFPEGSLFVHEKSLRERGFDEEDLVEAAEIITDKELQEIIISKSHNIAFLRI
ncbi:DsrE family protein [Methanobacterium alcaliphilum]|uniref:DsrE family protein n=1 Tax=Methanobacterium alcaliphilum TaxID=392018 RepID=UPI00200A3C3A|nr:DsrE family protein [Methanobacterium alcaliphilum]MCK9151084.1 DsrE family protein [Methanobacterium alcaliphilum]